MSGDEAYEEDGDGPWARTRRRRARGKGPRVYTTSRGRYGRNMGRGGRGIKRGPRRPAEPTQEFTTLEGAATEAFIDEKNYEKALTLIQKAISINPEVYSAHSLVSEIYFAQGEEEKAIAALLTGAHALPREPSVWQQIAEVCLRRVSETNRQSALQSASYCFARLLQIDQDDLDARFQRAAISRQLGNRGKALKDLERLLVVLPNNPSVLRQMAEVYTDMKKPNRARELYERSIAYHQSIDDRESFTFSDVNVYVELFSFTEEYLRAIAVLKSLSRWLLGRKDELFWDSIQEDDREFDIEDRPRRIQSSSFVPGAHPPEAYGYGLPLELRVKLGLLRLKLGQSNFEEALRHLSWLNEDPSTLQTNVEDYPDLFREAASALKKVGLYQEALKYYEPLLASKAYSDTEFLLGTGNCMLECGQDDTALNLFEEAKRADASNVEARLQLARLYNAKGLVAKARTNAQEAVTLGRQNLVRAQRRRYERREQREQRERAEKELKLAHNLKFSKLKSKPRGANPGIPLWREGTSKQSIPVQDGPKPAKKADKEVKKKAAAEAAATAKAAAAKDKLADMEVKYSALLLLQEEVRAGHSEARDEWLDVADDMIRDFRSNRIFFPPERYIIFDGSEGGFRRHAHRRALPGTAEESGYVHGSNGNMLDQPGQIMGSDSDVPTTYCGLSFSQWLDIFLEYSLILARMGPEHKQQSYATIEAATDCTIWFHSPEAMLLIHTVWFTCALALRDAETMNGLALRWFMKEYQFVSDIYKMFSALNFVYQQDPADRLSLTRNADWRSGPNQKFLLRQIKANDYHLPADYNMGDNAMDDAGPIPNFMREEGKTAEDKSSTLTYKDPETGSALPPQEMDIALLVLYGHILYGSNSFPNALHYFYRAYSLNNKSPLVCLSIALAYIHQSLKRQSDNRHMLIIQGMAFFQEYVTCRLEGVSMEEKQKAVTEVEYNKARIWHLLGISHLAVEGYWKILRGKENDSVKRDAALALQMIYALSGHTEKARDITERWLVLE